MATLGPDEIKTQHIGSMGHTLGELFFFLEQDLTLLYFQWNEYVAAFGTNEARIDLLNSAAGGFARSFQDSLWANVLLGLTRLTDPPKSFGKTNLSVTRLVEELDGEFREQVDALVQAAVDSTAFARDWRNRYLAHRDLSHAMDSSAVPLQEASRLKVRQALDAIVEVMNKVQGNFENTTAYYSAAQYTNGIDQLLYIIDDGLRADRERRERLKAGKPAPQDLTRRQL